MDLNILWFILIAVLFIGYFFLEGFDYGVGILLPFIGKSDNERRQVINTIGPFWDGNEVWLLTAGGAIFAAFPHWYATLFSGFYLALVLMLLGLIVRGVGFEFRSKHESPQWRTFWDWMIFAGSFIPAFLWGVAFGNIIRGIPINQNMEYTGGFFNLLNPFALLGGMATLVMFMLHGAVFLNLKTSDILRERALRIAYRLWIPAMVIVFGYVIASYFSTDIFIRTGLNPGISPVIAAGALIVTGWLLKRGFSGWAFVTTGLTIIFSTVTLFMGLYPRVLISSTDPAYSLTIYNAASTPYTLGIMSIVALIFVPIVLGYQVWTYWIFRKRISADTRMEY